MFIYVSTGLVQPPTRYILAKNTYKKCLLLGNQRCHPCHSSFNFVILGKFPPVWPGFLTKKVVVNIVKHHVTAVFLRFKISHIDANLQWYLGRWKLPSTEKAFSEAQRKHKRPGR